MGTADEGGGEERVGESGACEEEEGMSPERFPESSHQHIHPDQTLCHGRTEEARRQNLTSRSTNWPPRVQAYRTEGLSKAPVAEIAVLHQWLQTMKTKRIVAWMEEAAEDYC